MKSDFYGIIIAVLTIIATIVTLLNFLGYSSTVFVALAVASFSVLLGYGIQKSGFVSKFDDDTEEELKPEKNEEDGLNDNTQINTIQNTVRIDSDENTGKTLCLTAIPAALDLVGREKEIQEISAMLSDSSVVFIYGGAGVGKTAIAKSLINNEKKKILLGESYYKHVAWITCGNSIKEDFLMLDIPTVNRSNKTDETIQYITNWLQIHPSFIVIDQIDWPLEKGDIDFLNTVSGKTKILITTRVHNPVFDTFCLADLDMDSCLMLFYRYYLNDTGDLSDSKIIERNDKEYAENIISIASHNTLLIELMGKMAYSENWKLDALWEKLKKDVYGQDSRYPIETDHGNDGSLLKHIQKLYKMSLLSERKKEIMSFIALFPAEHSIFFDVFDWAGFMNDPDDNLGELQELGWIERDDNGYLIHTIVKGSVEQQYKTVFDELQYEKLIKELSNTSQYMPSDMDYKIKRERIIVPETICRLLADNGSENPNTSALFNSLAEVYSELGKYDKALEYYRKALAIDEKVLGPEHPTIIMSYNNIAGVYTKLGNYEEAQRHIDKALAINEKILGTENPEIALTYSNIAAVYFAKGEYDKALEYYKKALAINEKVLGPEHLTTAMSYNNMAGVYMELGNYEEAQGYIDKALAINEKILGTENPEIAVTYSNIAAVYFARGEYDKALEYYKKALAINEKVLGPEHLTTAMTNSDIAGLFYCMKNYEAAKGYYEKALNTYISVLGADHPFTSYLKKQLDDVNRKLFITSLLT